MSLSADGPTKGLVMLNLREKMSAHPRSSCLMLLATQDVDSMAGLVNGRLSQTDCRD